MGQVESLSWGFEYDVAFDLKKGIKFKLGNSGHILGSAFIAFKSGIDGWSITFSGDLGAKNTPILPDPSIPDPCDLLILESTYGDRLHEDRDNRLSNLGMLLSRALSDGGKVFIPSFSLGRTQELIYEMDRIFSDSELRKDFPDLNGESPVPVFIDSPLGLEITKIYATLFPFWDSEALRLRGEGDHPMDFRNLFGIMDLRAHISLLEMAGPAVVIAGSGMCTGGRIVAHLKKGLSDSRNDVLFVGYQGRGTPGRAIMRHGNKPGGYVCLDGEKVSINAGVHSLPGYSAHADQQELVDWVGSISGRPNRIKLVHGEDEPRKKLARQLALKGYDVMC
jgi:metallo-beta-lactamase family protein